MVMGGCLDSSLMNCGAPLQHGAPAGSWGHWLDRGGAIWRVVHPKTHVTCSGKKNSDLLGLGGRERPWSSR